MLRIYLFGAPQIEQSDRPIALRRSKALALMAYLALTGQPHDRDALLALLWPEFDTASARNNLRRELSLLKSALGEQILTADRMSVAWNATEAVWVDVTEFRRRIAIWRQHHADGGLCAACATELEAALTIYRDDLLVGASLADNPAFDEWQFFLREELREQLADALQALIAWRRGHGEMRAPLAYARRWLALDPLHEPAQRELIRQYALSGQYAAALRQYDECVRLFAAELGAEPEPETSALYAAIRARQFEAPPDHSINTQPAAIVAPPPQTPVAPKPRHNLPPTSGFVGRQRELVDLIRRLTDPDCRLLTLIGPGGIGKTRLALRAAQIIADEWTGPDGLTDGVLFVALAAVETLSGLLAALAATARFEFHHDAPPRQQVLEYFRTRRMLLILDNFEQLVDTAEFIAELLAIAPEVRLLITSRITLNLRDEWFHPLEGLAYPSAQDATLPTAQLARFDAVRLVERHARRISPGFSLSRARAAVVQLCQLVEGMPLALELATGWLKVFSIEQISAALERNLDILTARESDISPRHRSMRAVLEETWTLLSVAEKHALAGLTVFVGGFSAEAADVVANAGMELLASLVEKSLVRSAPDGRFHIHELLRQFAAEKLAAAPDNALAIRNRHSHYFLNIVACHEAQLTGSSQYQPDQQRTRLSALEEIGRDAANMRNAWLHAVEQGHYAALDRALYSYFMFFYVRGYIQEGAELFGRTTSITINPAEPLATKVHARALLRRGAFLAILGDYEAAIRSVEAGTQAGHGLAIESDIACGLITHGTIAGWRGDVTTARRLLHAGLAHGRNLNDTYLVTDALHELARLNGSYGDYDAGKQLAHESLLLSRAAGLTDREMRALQTLAWSRACLGEFDEAEACFQESLTLARQFGDTPGVAEALGGIGWVAWCCGAHRLREAQQYIDQSLTIARQMNDPLRIANFLGDRALMALDEDDIELAWKHGQEGLALAHGLDSAIYLAYHRCILGMSAARRGQFSAGWNDLREALRLTWHAEIWPMVAFTLYHCATTLRYQAEAHAAGKQVDATLMRQALEIFTLAAKLPATWQVFKIRANRQIDELRSLPPPDLFCATLAEGQQLDGVVERMLANGAP